MIKRTHRRALRRISLLLVMCLVPFFLTGCGLIGGILGGAASLVGGAVRLVGGAVGLALDGVGALGSALLGTQVSPEELRGEVAGPLPGAALAR